MAIGDSFGKEAVEELHQDVLAWEDQAGRLARELLGADSVRALVDGYKLVITVEAVKKEATK